MSRKYTIGLIGSIVGIVLLFFVYQFWFRTGSKDVTIVIPAGASFDQVLDTLESADLIGSRTAFKVLAKASGADGKIKPGTYKFTQGTSSTQLLKALTEGRSTALAKLTFPEGITIRRAAQIAAVGMGCDSAEFVAAATDTTFLRSIGIPENTAEGYLMPDTYFVPWGEHPKELITKMKELFDRFWNNEHVEQRSRELKLSPYQVLVLASIVEGEARAPEDRPIIAGVYVNRLRKGMKLEADPTIQYTLPEGPRRLLYADLRKDSPYNTYMHTGLPPTPINNPGRASVLATLDYSKHEFLFFVAKADGSGKHTFSRTPQEHAEAVKTYRKNAKLD